MNITYHREGDYFIPDIIAGEGSSVRIGKYGRARFKFLKEHRRGTWSELIMLGSLNEHLAEIDRVASARVKQIINEMAKVENTDEKLKNDEQLEWIRRMNNYKNCAEEIVYNELIFV